MVNTHAVKTPEKKSQSVANAVSPKQTGDGTAFQFVDDRPEAVAQRKLKKLVDNSSRVKQLAAFQKMANNSRETKQGAQLHQKANNFSGLNNKPVQRSIIIGDDDNAEEFTVDAILKKVFRRNLIPDVDKANAIEKILDMYSEKNKQFDSVEAMLEAARTKLNNEDKEEEGELPQLELSEIDRGEVDRALRHTSGKQLDVQAKVVEIMHLVKGNLVDSETVQYSSDLINNGLCGGWTVLFMKYPDWVEPIYNAVRSWKKPAKISGPEALLHFENHLTKTTKFKGAENVIKLLREVYDSMSRLEPEAGYDSLPDCTGVDVGELPVSATSDEKVTTDEIKFNLRKKNAANLVSREIQKRTSKEVQGDCMAHIESDLHHIALRVQKIPGKGKSAKLRLLITVVETEKNGMIKTNDWSQAEQILNSWLEEEEPDLKDVIVRIRMAGF